MEYNVINVAFRGLRRTVAPVICWQFDIRQVLRFTDIELPVAYRVDFCNLGDSTTKPSIGTAAGVEVPDEFLLTGRKIIAYIVVSSGGDDSETRYEITIPVTKRTPPSDVEPASAQRMTIDNYIALLNAEQDKIIVSDTQPEAVGNLIWVKSSPGQVQVPTYEEFEETKRDLQALADRVTALEA